MQRAKWFELVEQQTTHWDRKKGDTLILFFNGWEPAEFHEAMSNLTKAGARYVDHGFDKTSGKTHLLIREPELTE